MLRHCTAILWALCAIVMLGIMELQPSATPLNGFVVGFFLLFVLLWALEVGFILWRCSLFGSASYPELHNAPEPRHPGVPRRTNRAGHH